MTQKTEGTIVLDGLIEGRLPREGDVRPQIEQWRQFTQKMGLRLHVDASGASLSVLPDREATPVEPLGGKPEQSIRQAIQQLVDLFPAEARGQLFSTLRSSEYRPQQEVQSIYTIGPDGTVDVQQRTVDAQTVAPPRPISTREKVKMAGIGLLAALAVLGITSLFVDLRSLAGEVVDTVRPIDAAAIDIETGPFEPYIEVAKVEKTASRQLTLTLRRTDAYPLDDAALQQAFAAAGESPRQRLALERLAEGYIRVEMFDEEGAYLTSAPLRIRSLEKEAALDVKIALPQRTRIGRIALAL